MNQTWVAALFLKPASAGGTASLCTAYGRYLWSGYVEFQPIGRTPVVISSCSLNQSLLLEGNIPQPQLHGFHVTDSFERSVGVGFKLPKNFELRVTHIKWIGSGVQQVAGPGGPPHQRPYGLYATVGVRWSFGGYGSQSAFVGLLDRLLSIVTAVYSFSSSSSARPSS